MKTQISDLWERQTDDMLTIRLEVCVTAGVDGDAEIAILDSEGDDLIKGVVHPNVESAKRNAVEAIQALLARAERILR